MMSDIMIRMLQLSQKGYGCSQILIRLFLRRAARKTPPWSAPWPVWPMVAAGGRATCGTLTGACCALALYAGKGQDDEAGSNGCC